MASWCPNIQEAVDELGRDIPRYLECVRVIREECGHDPQWSSEGEWLPEPVLTVPEEWPVANVNGTVKSYMPSEDDGA